MEGISEYEYNLALFEVGSAVIEERYSAEDAKLIVLKKEAWSWLKIQQVGIHLEAIEVIRDKKAKGCEAVKLYREVLKDHLEGVHFNSRFEKMLLTK